MSEINNYTLCNTCGNVSRFDKDSFLESALIKFGEFVLVSCIVATLHFIDIVVLNEFKTQRLKLSALNLDAQRIIHIILLSLLILTLPFITILITGALLYKVICSVAIKRKDRRFVQFLDSYDVFHCLEENNTTDIEGIIQSKTLDLAVHNIKDKLHKVFRNDATDKMFYRRNEEYGFYYWRRYSFIDLAQYVQIVEIPDSCDTNSNLQLLSSKKKHSDQIIANNDEGLFKVLIMKNDHNETQYKIIIKFHQSVKNTALVDFIARLMEKSDDCEVILNSNPQLQDDETPDAIMNMITKLCNILAHSLEDNRDNQGRAMERLRTLEWTKSDENLLCKVKDMCDINLASVLQESISGIMRQLDRN